MAVIRKPLRNANAPLSLSARSDSPNASAYLAAFCYRFNRRIDLATLVAKLKADTALRESHPLRFIRAAEESC